MPYSESVKKAIAFLMVATVFCLGNVYASESVRVPGKEEGDASAQFRLGVMYEHGVPEDDQGAVRLYRRVAAQRTSAKSASGIVRAKIVTQIDKPDPQAGVKSTQNILIDFSEERVDQDFATGHTKIGSIELEAVRNKFLVKDVEFEGDSVTFTAVGQTASGVLFIPAINYSIKIKVNAEGTATGEAHHDGYPSYRVYVNGNRIYEHKHKHTEVLKTAPGNEMNRKF